MSEWVRNIRDGNFQAAEDELALNAAKRIYGEQLGNEVQEITENAGPYAKYVVGAVGQKLDQEVAQGKITSPRQFVSAYEQALQDEIANFHREVRPDSQAAEYGDYFASRRQAERKNKGL